MRAQCSTKGIDQREVLAAPSGERSAHDRDCSSPRPRARKGGWWCWWWSISSAIRTFLWLSHARPPASPAWAGSPDALRDGADGDAPGHAVSPRRYRRQRDVGNSSGRGALPGSGRGSRLSSLGSEDGGARPCAPHHRRHAEQHRRAAASSDRREDGAAVPGRSLRDLAPLVGADIGRWLHACLRRPVARVAPRARRKPSRMGVDPVATERIAGACCPHRRRGRARPADLGPEFRTPSSRQAGHHLYGPSATLGGTTIRFAPRPAVAALTGEAGRTDLLTCPGSSTTVGTSTGALARTVDAVLRVHTSCPLLDELASTGPGFRSCYLRSRTHADEADEQRLRSKADRSHRRLIPRLNRASTDPGSEGRGGSRSKGIGLALRRPSRGRSTSGGGAAPASRTVPRVPASEVAKWSVIRHSCSRADGQAPGVRSVWTLSRRLGPITLIWKTTAGP